MTMMESAARHLAAGVEDLDELARLVEQDIGKAPSKKSLTSYRAYSRKYGPSWVEDHLQSCRDRRAANPERSREVHREGNRRWQAKNPARHLLNTCRKSAQSRGHECAITADDIEALLAPMTCSATGLPLTWEYAGPTRANPWAPSIDRIDCARGYVLGNVRVVCWAFNQMRGDFPDEVVFALAKALAARAP